MIIQQKKPYDKDDVDATLHPLVKEWFFSNFKDYSPPQYYSIVNIHQRKNTIISSPTGSGKTLSAFLAILNDLVIRSLAGTLENRIYAVYVSPLKALGNDINRNLLAPLKEIEALAEKKYNQKLGIRVAVRTGDTTASQKSAMLRKPPHILITTPESLGIMITTIKFREHFRLIDWVIVDEIHALAENKRGVHLSLTMERLERLREGYCRVALSATVSPLMDIAKFLVGVKQVVENETQDIVFRDCFVVDVNALKQLDLQVMSPVRNIIREDFDVVNTATYKLIDDLVQAHKTTVIFTNTRSATERVVHHLKDSFPLHYDIIDDAEVEGEKKDVVGARIAAHHGSLSKDHRMMVEEQLKEGKLKVVVSSTSLELGIDIGSIDLVILLGSPKSVARALQRIGRSGHKLHEKAKGRIIVQDRDDLVECSVLLKSALEGKIDTIHIPMNALDVLAQQMLGIAIEDRISVNDMWLLVKKSYCFSRLAREDFDSLISYLSGEFVSLEDRHVYAKIWKDDDTGMLGKKGKLTRLIYMTNIGTIPDETNIKVKIGDAFIGMISEPFLEKLRRGDIFVLGGYTYEFRYAQGLTAFVKSAAGRRPTVPSWHSEMLPLSFDLACDIQKFRQYMNNYFSAKNTKKEILSFIHEYLYIDDWGADSLYEYFFEQFSYLEIPHLGKLLIEHYDDGRNKYVLFHSLFGRRTNDVLSRCIAFVISRVQKKDVEILISDNGFALRTNFSVQAIRSLRLLRSDELLRIAEQSLEKTEVLSRRFRHCAARALMILRNYKGKHKSVGKQQVSSRLLLSSVRQLDPNFVILKEARREVLEDLMDVQSAIQVVRWIEQGSLALKEVNTTIPSPFAFNLVMSGYTDILKMQDRQAFLRKMHEMVLAKMSLKKNIDNSVLDQAKHNPSFSYQELWQERDDKKVLSDDDFLVKILRDLKTACVKVQLPADIERDLQELLRRHIEKDSSRVQYKRESIVFLDELLKGTIPKVWKDDLIKIFRSELPEMTWKERG